MAATVARPGVHVQVDLTDLVPGVDCAGLQAAGVICDVDVARQLVTIDLMLVIGDVGQVTVSPDRVTVIA